MGPSRKTITPHHTDLLFTMDRGTEAGSEGRDDGDQGLLLTITPRHPVCIGGTWQRSEDAFRSPSAGDQGSMERSDSSDSSNADKEKDDEQDQQSCWVHNFVLEEGGFSLVLGGVECIPWGHGVEEHPILGNDSYYASRSVIMLQQEAKGN